MGRKHRRGWGTWMLVLVSTFCVPSITYAQSGHTPRFHIGVGGFLPQTDLPKGGGFFGTAQGRLDRGLLLWADFEPGFTARRVRPYAEASVSFVGVSMIGGGRGPDGSIWTGAVGLKLLPALAATVRPYVRLGLGAHLYRLGFAFACIPEDPTCNLASSYASNVLDPMIHVGVGADFPISETSVAVEVGQYFSRFDDGRNRAFQHVLVVQVGLAL